MVAGDCKSMGNRYLVSDVLPPLFEWMDIPAGKVTIVTEDNWRDNYIPKGEPTTFDISAFAMAKYPITNAQFEEFVTVGGYQHKSWWTDAGWEQREREKWTAPRNWADNQLKGDQQPVVGVSWYEAVAFCRWLSEVVGKTILLPTEQQWQRAAWALPDGEYSGYTYVWGNKWNGDTCHHSVKPHKSNQSSLITAYESRGNISPCGVVGMTGNVWEWCLTAYETGSQEVDGTDARILRGGSWLTDHPHYFRIVSRYVSYPDNGTEDRGFRIVSSHNSGTYD
jgi:formylglycine-generating enzyme required for sulfatase activity